MLFRSVSAPSVGSGGNPPAQSAASPSGVSAANADSAVPVASAPLVITGDPVEFDPGRLTPVLDDARLVAVKAAVTREAYVEAAQELDKVLSAEPRPSLDDERAFRFLLPRRSRGSYH